jgi:hypothetical protein
VETAARMTPLGCPGSVFFRVATLIVSSVESESTVQDWLPEALMLAQKVVTIRCDSFIIFVLASGVRTTEIYTHKEFKEHT